VAIFCHASPGVVIAVGNHHETGAIAGILAVPYGDEDLG
jgi:hypothetical protein